MPAIRQLEQRAAGAAIGVTDITFLNYVDGHLEATIGLRKDLVRQIRKSQPDRMVCQSPERNWDRIGASHPDHLAAGEAAIQAVYPDARNPFAFTDLLDQEGLQPWRVKEVWVSAYANPDHFVDITDTFDLKIKALQAHASQTAHNPELENMVREWGQRNAGLGGLPEGRIAEAFKIVNTN
jgi:LmbE family N-acetylglucosaminyl deacetylase